MLGRGHPKSTSQCGRAAPSLSCHHSLPADGNGCDVTSWLELAAPVAVLRALLRSLVVHAGRGALLQLPHAALHVFAHAPLQLVHLRHGQARARGMCVWGGGALGHALKGGAAAARQGGDRTARSPPRSSAVALSAPAGPPPAQNGACCQRRSCCPSDETRRPSAAPSAPSGRPWRPRGWHAAPARPHQTAPEGRAWGPIPGCPAPGGVLRPAAIKRAARLDATPVCRARPGP